VSLPAGRTDDGLPFGVQLAGRLGGDAALLAACARIEQVPGQST
jgi:aspartyl-tRNA(Asn)/glutamyl-tRNA(Gln) amidotransferase subunit A